MTESAAFLALISQYKNQHFANVSSSGTMYQNQQGQNYYISGDSRNVGNVFTPTQQAYVPQPPPIQTVSSYQASITPKQIAPSDYMRSPQQNNPFSFMGNIPVVDSLFKMGSSTSESITRGTLDTSVINKISTVPILGDIYNYGRSMSPTQFAYPRAIEQKQTPIDIITGGISNSINSYLSSWNTRVESERTPTAIPTTEQTTYKQEGLNLPFAGGSKVFSIEKIGVSTLEKKTPEPMTYAPTGNWLLGAGLAASKGIDDAFTSVQKAIPSGVTTSPIKAGLGFIEGIVQVAPMVPIVGGAAFMFGQQPVATASMVPKVATDMALGMWQRGTTEPERFLGNIIGAAEAPKVIGVAGRVATRISPIGIDIATIPTSVGSESKVLFGYTKGFGAPLETGNIRGWIGWGGKSEATKIIGSKSFGETNTAYLLTGKIPVFDSTSVAKRIFGTTEGNVGTFFHSSSSGSFLQKLLTEGKITVGGGAKGFDPLYFAPKDTIYTRFLQGGDQPSILRFVGKPKTVGEAALFEGNPITPKLPEGFYPGTKPLSGVTYKGGLQREYMIPSGSRIFVKGVSYTESGGAKIPVIDIGIGAPSYVDQFRNIIQKFEYNTNAIRKPAYGFGKPTEFLKGSDISMSNPLEEVASRQWTPQQKIVINPYMKSLSLAPDADLGVKVAVSGQDALVAIQKVNFVQRELAGEIIIGKDISAKAIGDIYKGRELMGKDVSSGGSTSIRANLGDSFFGRELIGDIDAWAKADLVEGMWKREKAIIKSEVPNVDKAMSKRGSGFANTFFDAKIGKAAEGKFPVGAVAKPGSAKPIVEIHSIEQFPHVVNPKNVATLKTVGGYKSTGMSTNFLFERKASAIFTDSRLLQSPGGKMRLPISDANIKHGVGAAAIGREGASLMYGRDAATTGMKVNYAKGRALEKFAVDLDKLLGTTKGKGLKEVLKYQQSIKTNPLELPVTKVAKAKAAILAGGKLPTSKMLGIGLPDIPVGKDWYYPSFAPSTKSMFMATAGTRTASVTSFMTTQRPIPKYSYEPTIARSGTKIPEVYKIPFVSSKTTTPSYGSSLISKESNIQSVIEGEYPNIGIRKSVTSKYPDYDFTPTGTTTKIPTWKQYTTPYPDIPKPIPRWKPYTSPYPTTTPKPTPYPKIPPTPTTTPKPEPRYYRYPEITTPVIYTPPIFRPNDEGRSKNKRKLRKRQPFREVIPIEYQWFNNQKTQQFEMRYTILKGTRQVVGGFVPPEYTPNFLDETQNYRATRGKGWIEAQFVNEVPNVAQSSRKTQTYQRERLPEPSLGISRSLYTIFKATQGRINSKMAFTPPTKLNPVGKRRKRRKV